MILELDVGNTRVKWRLVDAGGRLRGGSFATGENLSQLSLEKEGITEIRVANVAGDAARKSIDDWALASIGRKPAYARVVAEVGGVTCGYRNPAQLGVDRWLAVLAAWEEAQAPCLIADAGSALTLDLVDARARHLGGFIVPGLGLMRRSLINETSGARANSFGEDCRNYAQPGRSTDEAVHRGCITMAAGIIRNALALLPGNGLLFLTGGDAHLQRQFIR